jgi:hypothetical protein
MHKPSSVVLLAALAAAASPAACGSSSPSSDTASDAAVGDSGTGGRGDGGVLTGDAGGDSSLITNRTLLSVSITPGQAAIQSLNGSTATQQFQLMGSYSDNTVSAVPGASWSRDNPQVGDIGSGTGLYTANGSQGGTVTITGSAMGKTATATLVVKMELQDNPGNVPGSVQGALQGATALDTTVTWAYPYDATVFPRGTGEAPLMWNGGGASDVYYVHLTSPTFELQSFTSAPSGRYDFSASDWAGFVDATSGAAELKVARWDGAAATIVTDLHWTVAPGSMRGTIYYWAINTGRVMRIQGGATAPDDFLGPTVTCPSCHTVSANGNQLVMSEGTWPNDTSFNFDLQSSNTTYSGFTVTTGASEWSLAGVSPDGTTIVENFSPLRGPIGVQTGAFDSATGAAYASTGLEGNQLGMPAFAPDGKLLAYVNTTTNDLHVYDWDPVARKATNDRILVASAAIPASPIIEFPTVSPDHQWVIYGRGTALGSLGVPGDLYVASVVSPGTEISLDALNGKTYPFAAGARDRDLDYEPTFAPVAAGGYFWVVFHSRRTWGNALTGPAYVMEGQGVKQLWVAAFDQAPKAGADPSHSAFYLPGQDSTTLNMRGYWALDPCKGNGAGCQSGVECCGGYCASGGASADAGADAGNAALMCASSTNGCSQDGDKCAKSTDCCGATSGVTCINGVCAIPPPQ